MASVTERSGGYTIDTSAFTKLAKQLAEVDRRASAELDAGLAEAAEIVATGARAIAGQHSKTIPKTIKVRPPLRTKVEIRAGGKNVPIASLFELGNTGQRHTASVSRTGRFRHPVFGNRDVWVNQPMHPYLLPAAVASERYTRRIIERSLMRAFRSAGLKVE